MGNFRCIYPFLGSEKYDEFFYQNQSSLFQETAASRAREKCVRMHREELEVFILHFLFVYTELMPQKERGIQYGIFVRIHCYV
jgi:hypothetical protein